MNFKDQYKRTFSQVCPPERIQVEDILMTKQPKISFLKKHAAAVAAGLLLATGTGVYAADVGGIQSVLSGWFRGEKVDLNYRTESGQAHYSVIKDGESFQGGGVAIDDFGRERPLTPEEVQEAISTELVREGDSLIYYNKDKSVDVTPYITDPDKPTHLRLVWPDETIYLDIDPLEKDSLSYSSSGGEPLTSAEYTTVDLRNQ